MVSGGFMKKLTKGFTLIELLVVIAIIILISGLVIINVSKARVKGRDSKRISDLRSIQGALELFFEANKGYPKPDGGFQIGSDVSTVMDAWRGPSLNWIPDGAKSGDCSSPNTASLSNYNWSASYLSGTQPHDPVDNCKWPAEGAIGEAGEAGSYEYWSNGLRYLLAARLEDINNPEINGSKVIDPRSTFTPPNVYSQLWVNKGTALGQNFNLGQYAFVLTN